MTPQSQSQLMQEIEQGYTQIDKLWEATRGSKQSVGLDSQVFRQVEDHVTTARDALSNAREILSSTTVS